MNTALVFVLITVLVPMVVNECSALAPWLARRILRWSARRLRAPEKIERYSEEWLANLEEVPGKLTKLLHALGVAIFGVVKLRSRNPHLDWEPSPLVIPFDTDSIFGPGTAGLATLESSRGQFAVPARSPSAVDHSVADHRCGGLCGLACVWSHDSRKLAVAVIGLDVARTLNDDRVVGTPLPQLPRRHMDQARSRTSFVERWRTGLQDVEYRRKYAIEADLFSIDAKAAPPVIGQ